MTQVSIYYKNYRGEFSWRLIKPVSILWTSNEFHTEEQWLLQAFDVQKQAMRDFALNDILIWGDKPKGGDAVILNRYEDLFFKKVKGVYVQPEFQGLFDGVSEPMTAKIQAIKDKFRATELYQHGLDMFRVGYNVADSMEWHYKKLKSELAPEVAEAIKRFPTGVSYGVSVKEEHQQEVEELKAIIADHEATITKHEESIAKLASRIAEANTNNCNCGQRNCPVCQ